MTRTLGAATLAHHTLGASPASLGRSRQGWNEAERVRAPIARVAKEELILVTRPATDLAHFAVRATPVVDLSDLLHRLCRQFEA